MKNTIKNKAMDALIEMGVPANNKGFKYITDAMCLFDEDEMWRYGSTTLLYEKIAAMNKTSASSVERAIRHAFGETLAKGNLEAVEKYLSFQNTKNGNLLAVFYIKLSREDGCEKD